MEPRLGFHFQTIKEAIIDAFKMGVEIFDMKLLSCLWTVWLQQRIRYFQCSCPSRIPDCSSSLAGFRLLSSTEQHDGPIEIESLAITWGLEQTKFFTLGCCKLAIARDQKPTNKIFGDRMLDEISNTGIFHLKKNRFPGASTSFTYLANQTVLLMLYNTTPPLPKISNHQRTRWNPYGLL